MTDKAVSALTSLTGANAATGDLLYIVDISEAAAADRSKKITAQELQNYIKGFPATIGVGGATPAASGAGISFPATASASSDANTLDDYEEGVWSPTISSLTNLTGTASVSNATYTKIGRMVYLEATIGGLSITSTSSEVAFIATVPFNQSTNAARFVGGFFSDTGRAFGGVIDGTGSNSTEIYAMLSASDVTATGATTFALSLVYIAA